jgi:CBS domain containing-hemolysin-like protein
MSLLVIVLLVILAGYLAGVESAFNNMSRVLVDELASKRGGELVRKVHTDLPRYLNVVLLVRKGAELLSTALLYKYFLDSNNPTTALLYSVGIMILVAYIFVGVGPRTLGKQHPGSWARSGALISYALSVFLGPITRLLIAIGNAITPGKGYKSGPFANEEELRDLVDQAHERGLVEEDEHEMIHSVFELGDTLVRELMVPRTEMVWIESDKTLRQALSLALRSGYSRIPVVGESIDQIIGIAYIKDLAKRSHDHHEAEQTEKVEQLMRPVVFVPEIKSAAELLKDMQRDQIHLAIVVDEYGGTAGLITIEDIIEEIVGEIADEFDDEDEQFNWLSEDKLRVQAKVHIEDVASEIEVELDPELIDGVDTIGGLMAKVLGRVPIPGSTFNLAGWKVTAERPIGRRRRISSMILERQVSDRDSEVEL